MIRILCTLLFIGSHIFLVQSQNTLKGKIKDAGTGYPLIGATIYIPDIQTGTASDFEGNFLLQNLPSTQLLVQVRYIGYEPASEIIDLRTTTVRDFQLSETAIESREVVITGNGISTDNKRSSNAIIPVSKQDLIKSPAATIIEAISLNPGMSQITTGQNAAKPVIRGLSYNHVITVNEGVRQEGQQWGDEHGIEIDQFSPDRIEILKGPASLFYGSDAMGGVINILEPIHAPWNSVMGEAVTQFSTNNLLTKNSLMIQGNQSGLIWRGRGTFKSASAYRSAKGIIPNSGFNELNYSAMVGMNRKWGYSHLHYSHYGTRIGITESMDADVSRTRIPSLPFQDVFHDKITSVSNIITTKGQIRLNLGFQSNRRKEFETTAETPGLYMNLKTGTGDLKYTRLSPEKWEMVAGISFMLQQNTNLGSEYLIPDYTLSDVGGFLYGKLFLDNITINAGLRLDTRSVKGQMLIVNSSDSVWSTFDTIFPFFSSDFTSLSGSVGVTAGISDAFNLKCNLGSGFRAPNIAELGSNGVHPGTQRYEIGNPSLRAENSIQADGGLNTEFPFMTATLNLFVNYIFDYIYQRNIDGEQKLIGDISYPVYRFVQGNSILSGGEFEIDIHPVHAIHFMNSIDLVYGTNISEGMPLPYIPATRTQHSLRWNITTGKRSRITMPYLELGGKFYFRQTRVDPFETMSPGYFLLDASAGCQIRAGSQLCSVFCTATNLTNVLYFDHLNRLRESGIHNPGLNITLGVLIPFKISEQQTP